MTEGGEEPAPVWLIDALQNNPTVLRSLLQRDSSITKRYYTDDLFGDRLPLSTYALLGQYPIQTMTLLREFGDNHDPDMVLLQLVHIARASGCASSHLRLPMARLIRGCQQLRLNTMLEEFSIHRMDREDKGNMAFAFLRAGAEIPSSTKQACKSLQNYKLRLDTTRTALVVLLGLKHNGLRFGLVPKEVIRQIAKYCWDMVDDDERFVVVDVGHANKRTKV